MGMKFLGSAKVRIKCWRCEKKSEETKVALNDKKKVLFTQPLVQDWQLRGDEEVLFFNGTSYGKEWKPGRSGLLLTLCADCRGK